MVRFVCQRPSYVGSQCHLSRSGRCSRCNPDDSASQVSGGRGRRCICTSGSIVKLAMLLSRVSSSIAAKGSLKNKRSTFSDARSLSSSAFLSPFLHFHLFFLAAIWTHDGCGAPASCFLLQRSLFRAIGKAIKTYWLTNSYLLHTGNCSYSPIVYSGLQFSWWILDYCVPSEWIYFWSPNKLLGKIVFIQVFAVIFSYVYIQFLCTAIWEGSCMSIPISNAPTIHDNK